MKIAMAGIRGIPALYSGFETAATEIGVRLVKHGHEVVVYCRKGYGNEEEGSYQGIKKIYLPRLNYKFIDTLTHTFFTFLHLIGNRVDVLLIFNPANGPLCIIPRLLGIPFAINVDGLEWKRTKWPKIGQWYFYFAAWFCTKIASIIIADSQGIQNFYKKTFKRESHFIAYGADVKTSKSPERLQKYNLKKDNYFLVITRLDAENNTDLIIRAFRNVRTDKQLVIVGDMNYKSNYVSQLKNNGADHRVVFLGGIYNQDDLNEIICNCFAYIHGHMVGGTNPVLLQALGCGACVLFVDVIFNSSIVGNAGVPFQNNIDDLQTKLQNLINEQNRVHECKKLAPTCLTEQYTWDYVTDQYEKLCTTLTTPSIKNKCTR
ncbi:MAG: DUF1972 domain-containing protein [Candidatus Omnitrophica bacterium]|nr:DUF1972 domain-containing protein [Candidatus Omnitrophota bacterium]